MLHRFLTSLWLLSGFTEGLTLVSVPLNRDLHSAFQAIDSFLAEAQINKNDQIFLLSQWVKKKNSDKRIDCSLHFNSKDMKWTIDFKYTFHSTKSQHRLVCQTVGGSNQWCLAESCLSVFMAWDECLSHQQEYSNLCIIWKKNDLFPQLVGRLMVSLTTHPMIH